MRNGLGRYGVPRWSEYYGETVAAYKASPKGQWEKRARAAGRKISAGLKAQGFEVSPVRFNAGGPAVMGEVYFYARALDSANLHYGSPTARENAVYVQVSDYDGESIMYRTEERPEHLGGGRGHKRSGPNRFFPLRFGIGETEIEMIAREAFKAY